MAQSQHAKFAEDRSVRRWPNAGLVFCGGIVLLGYVDSAIDGKEYHAEGSAYALISYLSSTI